SDAVQAGTLTIIRQPAALRRFVPLPVAELVSSHRHTFSVIRVGRTLLMLFMLYYVLSSGVQLAGGSALPLAPFPWASSGSAATAAAYPLRMDGKMVTRMRPMTQMRRLDLYDSRAQFDKWAGSACSAASLAEILTAYGLPNMTIGRIIRE